MNIKIYENEIERKIVSSNMEYNLTSIIIENEKRA
jgi:hypothetical protein